MKYINLKVVLLSFFRILKGVYRYQFKRKLIGGNKNLISFQSILGKFSNGSKLERVGHSKRKLAWRYYTACFSGQNSTKAC